MSRSEIFKILIYARNQFEYYESDNIEFHYFLSYGMCHYLLKSFQENGYGYEIKKYNEIRNYIPEFNQSYLGSTNFYEVGLWWSMNDIKSRLEAFDKLIEIYKDHENNN